MSSANRRKLRSVYQRAAFSLSALLLTSCATTASNNGDLARLHLFDSSGAPRFSLWYSCAGQVSAETELCWVPSKYFTLWARERHVAIRELTTDGAFDANAGLPSAELAKSGGDVDYRIVVRFAPFATPSYTSENTGMGGFVPPKVGYQAELYVYAASDGRLIVQTDYRKKSDAPFKADSVPYIKAGVQAVLGALDPAYSSDIASSKASVPCAERPGRSAQGCGSAH
jgi:hypothetical protein